MSTDKIPQPGLQLAYRLAREALGKIDELEQQCLNSGAQCLNSQTVVINYLNRSYRVTLADAEVLPVNGGEGLSLREKILVLHYFIRAKGTPLSGRVIAYKELPDAPNYFPVFSKRAIKPLTDNFGGAPERLLEVAAPLGGQKSEFGDVSVKLTAFPRVPLILVLWKGDDEFPPNGNIMFDSTIPDYLSTDDINVLCETIAWKLVKLAR